MQNCAKMEVLAQFKGKTREEAGQGLSESVWSYQSVSVKRSG